MKQKILDDLINPTTKNKLVLKNSIVENGEIKSGILYDDNTEYFIENYVPRFIKNELNKTQISFGHKWKIFAEAMTEFGKSLREMKISINIPKDIPYLNINAGKYDLQRFIYQNFFKCWWDDKGDKEYSNAVNFDWYHPPYAFRYSRDEFEKWFRDEGLEIENLNELESGYAVKAIKPQ